jgi:hypothetical protein
MNSTKARTEEYSPTKLVQDRRKKVMLERKIEMLNRLRIKTSVNERELMNVTPCSQALKDSIKLIGDQAPRAHSKNLSFGFNQSLAPSEGSKFFMPLFNLNKYDEPKRPCARDGHVAFVEAGYMYVFGGDRHKIGFSDTYRFELK